MSFSQCMLIKLSIFWDLVRLQWRRKFWAVSTPLATYARFMVTNQ